MSGQEPGSILLVRQKTPPCHPFIAIDIFFPIFLHTEMSCSTFTLSFWKGEVSKEIWDTGIILDRVGGQGMKLILLP